MLLQATVLMPRLTSRMSLMRSPAGCLRWRSRKETFRTEDRLEERGLGRPRRIAGYVFVLRAPSRSSALAMAAAGRGEIALPLLVEESWSCSNSASRNRTAGPRHRFLATVDATPLNQMLNARLSYTRLNTWQQASAI